MEILRIGNHSVKVTLDLYEANEYNIFDSDNHKIFELLNMVKEKIDFSYEERKIFTEIYPSKKGGCDIFINCVLTEEDSFVGAEKCVNQECTKNRKNYYIFNVDSFEILVSLCYRLNEINYKGKSTIYRDEENERYFITLENASVKDLKYAFLLEYAKQIKFGTFEYVKEHCKCVLKDNAVHKLAVLI